MGQEPSKGPCCSAKPPPEDEEEDGEYLSAKGLEALIDENRAEVEKALKQISRKRAEVQESARQVDVRRAEVDKAFEDVRSEREQLQEQWCELRLNREALHEERAEVGRLQAELQAGQAALQVERLEVSAVRAELQASQQSWWFSCSATPGEKKRHADAPMPCGATVRAPEPDPTRTQPSLSFETHLPQDLGSERFMHASERAYAHGGC